MKEAAGEANMTVITIVLIGVVAAVGLVLVPRLMKDTNRKSCCTNAGGTWDGSRSTCTSVSGVPYNHSTYSSCVNGK